MGKRAFLTDRREEFLDGDYDLEESSDRHVKRRLESSAETAVEELMEVAESPHIDNRDVFDPQDLLRLLGAIMQPGEYGFTVQAPADEITDEWIAYQHKVELQLQHLLDIYREQTRQTMGQDG